MTIYPRCVAPDRCLAHDAPSPAFQAHLQPADWYVRAQRFRRSYRDKVNALFKDWDVLLTVATPVSAPAIGTG